MSSINNLTNKLYIVIGVLLALVVIIEQGATVVMMDVDTDGLSETADIVGGREPSTYNSSVV